jgi:hypothetical protein
MGIHESIGLILLGQRVPTFVVTGITWKRALGKKLNPLLEDDEVLIN